MKLLIAATLLPDDYPTDLVGHRKMEVRVAALSSREPDLTPPLLAEILCTPDGPDDAAINDLVAEFRAKLEQARAVTKMCEQTASRACVIVPLGTLPMNVVFGKT